MGADPLGQLETSVLCPSAWLYGVAVAAATGVLGCDSAAGLAVAGATGLLVFILVATRAAARRRAAVVNDRGATDRRELDRLLATLDGVQAMMWHSGDDAARIAVSSVWYAITGQSEEEALGRGWLDTVHPDDRSRRETAERLAASMKEPFEVEYRLRGTDQEYGWVLDRAAPYYEGGRFAGYVGLTMDVNHRQRSDREQELDEVLRMNETINAQAIELVDRWESISASKQRAEEEERLKHDYLAALSEDLRGPIEDIRAVVDMLKPDDVTDRALSFLDRMRGASGVLDGLLERAVELISRDDEAEAVYSCEADLRRLVDAVFASQKSAAEERGLTVTIEVEDAVPGLVEADPVRIRRMLTDLWNATLRLAKKGTITLRVRAVSKPDTPTLIRVTLTHDGSATTAGQLERVFYPVEPIGDEPAGLGLGPCKRLAERMGGKIGVQRDDDGSVTFWFTLQVIELNPNYDGRRAHGRLIQESVQSTLGVVLDLSMGGMRVWCAKVPNEIVQVSIFDDEERIELSAKVAWSRRIGFGKHDAGLMFLDFDTQKAAQLSRLAVRNRLRRVLDVSSAA